MSVANSALTGMNGASKNLEVLGNNIANAKTVGFKQSYVGFADSFYNGSVGNQIGTGVKVASVTQDFSQGSVNVTGRTMDMAINSDGFFVLTDATSGGRIYSRNGAFHTDADGNVVNQTGSLVQGYIADSTGTMSATPANLTISSSAIPASATTTVTYDQNLDASSTIIPVGTAFNAADPATYNTRADTTIYDSLGNSHTLSTYYRKTAANTWNVYVYGDGTNITQAAPAVNTLTFTSAGALVSPGGAGGGLSSIPWTPAGGAAALSLTLGYNNTTQFGIPSEIRSIGQNGYSAGSLNGITVDNDGIITGRYTNGQTKPLAQFALATFQNPNGLYNNGNVSWSETSTSGPALIQSSNSSGAFQSGALEDSNVDLTQQLVELIFAQRAFQANAQTVRAADTITQTVINIQ